MSRTSALERLLVAVLGLYLLGTGVSAILGGRWFYPNYLRLPTLAPVAAILGLGLLVVALSRPKGTEPPVRRRAGHPRPRLRGRGRSGEGGRPETTA